MKIKSIILACMFAVLLLLLIFQFVSASAELGQAKQSSAVLPPLSPAESRLAVPMQQGVFLTATLQAASGAEVPFHPNNDPDPAVEVFRPHLVLYQDGKLTPEVSRAPIVTANSALSFSSLNSVVRKQEVV